MNDVGSIGLTPGERSARLRLARCQSVGPITFRRLLERFATAEAALDALPEMARRGGRRKPVKVASIESVEAEMAAVDAIGGEITILGDSSYPALLEAIEDPPPALTLMGRTELLDGRCIGIVGARNASAIGLKFARQIATELAGEDLMVVSGLARGIDAAAHQGALDGQSGGTIAVLGGGLDVFYPKENRELQNRIAEDGLLVSEHPPGTQPQASHFPRRNRIISGLSQGIIVIEAAMRSGSLITARLAGEQGREVFAVPGSPLDPRARGSNGLIRQGAELIEGASDVIEALSSLPSLPHTPRAPHAPHAPLAEPTESSFRSAGAVTGLPDIEDSARALVREKLNPAPVAIDEIMRQCELPPATVLTILLELELAGIGQRHPGNKVSLA